MSVNMYIHLVIVITFMLAQSDALIQWAVTLHVRVLGLLPTR